MSTIYLLHIKGYDPITSTEKTLYFSSSMYITGASNLPPGGVAHTWYSPRIGETVRIERNAWGQGTIGGKSEIGFGVAELVNMDGGLDYLKTWGFDGRTITAIVGEVNPGGVPVWTTAFTATMAAPVVELDRVMFYLRDRQIELDKPLCTANYGGTNILPNGRDGTPDDIGGQNIPVLMGTSSNISPVCVNTSRLIYQVNNGPIVTVDASYDQALGHTKGTDYTDEADMQTNAPGAATYRVWPAGGCYRLGSDLAGKHTCTATQGATAADRTAGQIFKRIALIAGISAGDISASDITAIDTLQPAEVEIFRQDDTTCGDAIAEICNSIGAWSGFDRLGILRIKRLDAPVGSPVVTFNETNISDIETVKNGDTDIPVWKFFLQYQRNYTLQDSDIESSVTFARRGFISQTYRKKIAWDNAVRTKNKLARIVTETTSLTNAAAAQAECTRRFNIFKVAREIFRVTAFVDNATLALVDIGTEIRIELDRLGLDAGKNFIVLGVNTDVIAGEIQMYVWG
nr:hypothetical protein [uncultured Undibacterium sp.]